MDLQEQVEVFARDLNDLIAGVLEGPVESFEVDILHDAHESRVAVRQQPSSGIPVLVKSECLLRLLVEFDCMWDSAHSYLAIQRSTISVLLDGVTEPLYHYDFLADGDGKVPSAHLNVHGHRDEMVHAMVMAARRHRGKAREASLNKGKVTRLSTFHFPLGGHRFRPALEDVLEGIVREFAVDTKRGWETAVGAGRARWRSRQLMAAVRDDPASVVEMLEELGFAVNSPAGGVPARRDDRVLAW